jgi:hypothetical protein
VRRDPPLQLGRNIERLQRDGGRVGSVRRLDLDLEDRTGADLSGNQEARLDEAVTCGVCFGANTGFVRQCQAGSDRPDELAATWVIRRDPERGTVTAPDRLGAEDECTEGDVEGGELNRRDDRQEQDTAEETDRQADGTVAAGLGPALVVAAQKLQFARSIGPVSNSSLPIMQLSWHSLSVPALGSGSS